MVTLDQGGAGRPFLAVRRWAGAGAGLAEMSWILGPVPAASGSSWRIVPDTHPHLIHHRFRDGRGRTTFVGPRSRFLDVPQDVRAFTVGVRLVPGALPRLLEVSAWELRDRSIPVAEALGRRGSDLAARLSREEAPRRVEELLRSLFLGIPRRPVDRRVRGFLAHLGRPEGDAPGGPIRRIAELIEVSERSLREVCRSRIGLRPKEAHRIARLHRALEAGIRGRPDAEAACLAGYADQAHLIRESRTLLGTTPARFRARGVAVLSNTRRAPGR